MTIFEKIQAVRVEINKTPLKMTGKNKGTNFEYFELGDFLPTLNMSMAAHKMTAIASFTRDEATLTAINCEDPADRFTITSPFGSAELRGCHEVQNIGAVETYQRRYLYMTMFDINDKDILDAVLDAKSVSPGKKAPETANSSTHKNEAHKAENKALKVEPDNAASDDSDVPFPEEDYKCAMCGKAISKQLFEGSLKKYGTPLCSKECLAVLKKAEQAGR